MQAILEYAWPKPIAKFASDPKKLPLLLAIPIILFIIVGVPTGLLNFTPRGGQIVHPHFFPPGLST
jgi:quinone-modifying oxidoreductase subunit QmoC